MCQLKGVFLMSKKSFYLILVILLIISLIFVSKPYVKEYSISYMEEDLKVKENILNGKITVFDAKSLEWVDKDVYLNSRKSAYLEAQKEVINKRFDSLKITSYQTLLDIVEQDYEDYEFIDDGRRAMLTISIMSADNHNDFIEVAKERQKVIEQFNGFVDKERVNQLETLENQAN